MTNRIAWALPIWLAGTLSCFAEEYLVQVEQIVDGQVKYSMESLANLDTPYHHKVKVGPETLVVGGKLSSRSDGKFLLNFRYRRSRDTGVKVPG